MILVINKTNDTLQALFTRGGRRRSRAQARKGRVSGEYYHCTLYPETGCRIITELVHQGNTITEQLMLYFIQPSLDCK